MSYAATIADAARFTANQCGGVDRQGGLAGARRYVAEALLAKLGVAGGFELRPASGGDKSLVYLLTLAGNERLVLRADRGVRLLRKRMRHHTLLGSLGFACPANVLLDASRATRRRFGQAFLVERRVAGVNFEDGDPCHSAAPIGETFARLHGFVGRTAGAPGVWRRPANVGRRLQSLARKMLRQHRELKLPDTERIERWLGNLPPAAWRQKPRLCHQDVSTNNILIGGPRIGLVDLAELGYSSAAYELGRLRVKLYPNDDRAWQVCRESYFAAANESLREEIEGAWRVGLALACLHYALHTPFPDRRRARLADLAQVVAS